MSDRRTDRYFPFDTDGGLCGWESSAQGRKREDGAAQRLAFNGIHVISPEIFPRMTETGAFPINRTYLRLAGEGARIRALRTDDCYYKDIGSPAKLEEVRRRAAERGLPV